MFILLLGIFFVLPTEAALPVKDGTLIQGSSAKIYVMDGGQKRLINSEDLAILGYQRAGIFRIIDAELKKIPDGPVMNKDSNYPEGTVFRNRLSRTKIYLLQGGLKRYIPSPAILKKMGYRAEDVVAMPYASFKKITEGAVISEAESKGQRTSTGGPETYITFGPERIIARRDVIFRFVGVALFGDPHTVTFETKLEPVDKTWVDIGKTDYRQMELPPQGGTYTFSVRAKDSLGQVDPAPPTMVFVLDLSQQYQKVRIEGIASAGIFDSEEIRLRNTSGVPVDLTGWTITNRRGEKYPLMALKNYIYPEVPVNQGVFVLPDSSLVRVFTKKSPRGDDSFRLNKCTGYLNQDFVFNPRLPEECPRPTREVVEQFENKCRAFLENVTACRVPKTVGTTIETDWVCTGYVTDHLNYAGCVKDHFAEVGFWRNEWWAYRNVSRASFDRVHDALVLRDQAGQVVDRYSY